MYYNMIISEGFWKQVNVGYDWCLTPVGETDENSSDDLTNSGRKICYYLKYV